jgi:hypothetical protein
VSAIDFVEQEFERLSAGLKRVRDMEIKRSEAKREIELWKKGKAQEEYELYNLPTEYGGGIAVMRDWVINLKEQEVRVLDTKIISLKGSLVEDRAMPNE